MVGAETPVRFDTSPISNPAILPSRHLEANLKVNTAFSLDLQACFNLYARLCSGFSAVRCKLQQGVQLMKTRLSGVLAMLIGLLTITTAAAATRVGATGGCPCPFCK